MRCHFVDVFAEQPLAGNQLAVVLDAAELSSERMQAIARETNFSETTFVTGRDNGRAQVRIFTPTKELPFAGHPTLGTAWVLAREAQGKPSEITLELGIGDVKVEFDTETDIVWLESPSAGFSAGISPAEAAELLGLNTDDLVPEYPLKRGSLGPCFQLIAVKSLDVLARCQLNTERFAQFTANKETVESLFVFTSEGHSADADFSARMFFDADGPREDPATGSANCCFAAYLQELFKGSFSAIVDQGVEMGRASKIYLEVSNSIRIGGKVQSVFSGELTLPHSEGSKT